MSNHIPALIVGGIAFAFFAILLYNMGLNERRKRAGKKIPETETTEQEGSNQ